MVMAINVKGVFWSMKAEIPAMLKSGGGVIINNSSVLGLKACPGAAAYNTSKGAMANTGNVWVATTSGMKRLSRNRTWESSMAMD